MIQGNPIPHTDPTRMRTPCHLWEHLVEAGLLLSRVSPSVKKLAGTRDQLLPWLQTGFVLLLKQNYFSLAKQYVESSCVHQTKTAALAAAPLGSMVPDYNSAAKGKGFPGFLRINQEKTFLGPTFSDTKV